jgi:hypothetical protein
MSQQIIKVLALVATASVCLICSVATAAPHRSRNCLPRGARTVARDRLVRVYSVPDKRGFKSDRFYSACAFRDGATVLLGGGPSQRPSHLVVAGAFVAYTSTSFGVDSGCTSISIIDVPAPTEIILPARYCYVDAGFVSAGGVSDLVVSPHGTVGWIAYSGRDRQRGSISYKVQQANFSGATSTLDEGPGIVPGSLRLNGTTLTWVKEGRTVSVELHA